MNRPGEMPETFGFRAQPFVFFTVRLACEISESIRIPRLLMFELMIVTGWLVSIDTAGVEGLLLCQFPVYVPPLVMTIGLDQVTLVGGWLTAGMMPPLATGVPPVLP